MKRQSIWQKELFQWPTWLGPLVLKVFAALILLLVSGIVALAFRDGFRSLIALQSVGVPVWLSAFALAVASASCAFGAILLLRGNRLVLSGLSPSLFMVGFLSKKSYPSEAIWLVFGIFLLGSIGSLVCTIYFARNKPTVGG